MRWFILIVVVLVGIGIFGSQEEPLEVDIGRIERGDVENLITNSRAGEIRTRQEAMISTEFPGRLTKIHAREGTRVTKGDVLFALDPSDRALILEESLSSLELLKASAGQAQANAERAAGDLKRATRLKQGDQISKEEYERIRLEHVGLNAAHRASLSAVAEAEDRVDRARNDLKKCVVHAPFPGIVTERYHEEGEWAMPGDAVLELVNVDRLYVVVDIDETDMGDLRVGLATRVSLDPWKGQTFAGKVVRVSSKLKLAERQNRTLETEIELDPWDVKVYQLLPGISADAEIIVHVNRDVIRVPSNGMLEGGRVWFVEDGLIVERTIKTGLRNWAWIEVLEGAAEGDVVVTSLGDDDLEPGRLVTIRE